LFTGLWRKKLFKVADAVLELPAGKHDYWPMQMHEPLHIGLMLCFISSFPWQLRGTPAILDMSGQVHHLWKDEREDTRSLLFQLCNFLGVLDRML
jgi:hypothetical protein